jgi:hypothetical protein
MDNQVDPENQLEINFDFISKHLEINNIKYT